MIVDLDLYHRPGVGLVGLGLSTLRRPLGSAKRDRSERPLKSLRDLANFDQRANWATPAKWPPLANVGIGGCESPQPS